MDLNQFRESGVLELYVAGVCSPKEKQKVEQAIIRYPELKIDLYEIGSVLETYATIHKIEPSMGIKNSLLKKVNESNTNPNKQIGLNNGPWKWLSALAIMCSVLLTYLFLSNQSALIALQKEYEDQQIICDSIQNQQQLEYALLNDIQDTSNTILAFTATSTFDQTDIYLIYNELSQKNFIHVNHLPPITEQQSYQLWSLKADIAPKPLTVFQGNEGAIIPVDYEEGTGTYAITIENRGGADSPNLSNLIGTASI